MNKDVKEMLFDEQTIKTRVKELADRINKDYAGQSIILMIILKGSVIFSADLMRNLDVNVFLDCMQVSSYGSSSVSSGKVKIKQDCASDVKGKNVLIVEDIIDSGITLKAVKEIMEERGANTEICALLTKPARREVDVDVKYLGMEIPDEFVVGYGLDYAERYRNLPYIGILKREIYEH